MQDVAALDKTDESETSSKSDKTIAETYAEFALNLRPDDIPADVRERAKYLILDSIGCALASSRYPFARKYSRRFERACRGR